jgi:hypothetical protein
MSNERHEVPNSPGAIMARMAAIEVELANLGNSWSSAASSEKRLDRIRKMRKAQLFMAKGSLGARQGGATDTFKESQVEDELWQEITEDGEPLMEALTTAEAGNAGGTAKYKTLDRELSSLQTRLTALVRIENAPTFQNQTGVGE